MRDLTGDIIWVGGLNSHDMNDEPKKRGLIVFGHGGKFCMNREFVVGVPTTTSAMPMLARGYISLNGRLTDRYSVTREEFDPMQGQAPHLQNALDAMQAEMNPGIERVKPASSHLRNMQAAMDKVCKPELYAETGLCVAMPRRLPYIDTPTDYSGQLTREGYFQVKSQTLQKFHFPPAQKADKVLYAEFNTRPLFGSIVFFNYTAMSDSRLHNRGWLGAAYVVAAGKRYGFYENSVVVCPLDYTKPSQPVPDVYPAMRMAFSNIRNQQPMYPQLDSVFAVPNTCRFLYGITHGRIEEDQAQDVSRMVKRVMIDKSEVMKYLKLFGLGARNYDPQRNNPSQTPPAKKLDC